MPSLAPPRRKPFAVAAVVALGAGLFAPAIALPAHAETTSPADTSYAAFTTVAGASASFSADARVRSFEVSSSTEFGYSRRSMQTVTDGDAVVLQTINENGTLDASVDLSGVLDEVDGGFQYNEWGAGNVLRVYVWGSLNGEAALVRVESPEKRTLTGATVVSVSSSVIDVDRLETFGLAGTGLMAVLAEDDGSYVAQRTDYRAATAVGGEIVLDFPEASDRTFAIDGSYGNIVSFHDGGVDVISRYAPETVYSVNVEALGAAVDVDVQGTSVAVADADGDVALFSLDFSATHKLVGTARVEGGVRGLAVASGAAELWAVPADGASIQRFTTAAMKSLEPLPLDGLRVLEGSLESLTFDSGARLSAAVGDHGVYNYNTSLQRSAGVFVYQGAQNANISNPDKRGDGMTWSFAALGAGQMTGVWEYSLDGGEHWADRGAEWISAAPDRGDTIAEPAALPAPLDGIAPALRKQVRASELNYTSAFSRAEYSLSVPDYGYDALWRVRVSNAFSSVASTPRAITIASESGAEQPGASVAPQLTRHPASTSVAQSEVVELHAGSTGTPTPRVAWERSRDGGATWSVIARQTSTTLPVTGRLQDSGSLYRAVFTNESGSVTTQAAKVNVASPAAPLIGAAPDGAVVVDAGTLDYKISQYAAEWLRAAVGENVALGADEDPTTFSNGTGWAHADSGAAQLVWTGAVVYEPYGGLNGIHLTIANPYLAIAPDGRATLSASVAWNNGGGMGGSGESKESNGFTRVLLATFATSDLVIDGDSASFSGTPEWAGRSYVKPGLADATVYPSSFPASLVDYLADELRAWFLATGNSRDVEKAPAPVTAGFQVGTDVASTEGETIDPVEPLDALPVVTQRPSSVTVTAGHTVSLEAAASGRPVPTVRWQVETDGSWVDVPGATSAKLALGVAAEGTNRYRAVFTNRVGETASAAARVKVDPAPEITAHTPTITGNAGLSSTLVAEAGAWGPDGVALSYQWSRDGDAIEGAIATNYKVVADDQGTALTVSVTGSYTGQEPVTRTSSAVRVAAAEPSPEPTVEPTPGPTVDPTPGPTVTPTPTPTPGSGGELPTTGTRSPVADDTLTESTRGDVSAPKSIAAGDTFSVQLGRERAGETVDVWLHSTPTLLATPTVAADGSVRVVLPVSTTPGAHRLVVTALDGTLIGWTPVTVTAPSGDPLAATGGTIPLAAGGLALFMVALGVAVLTVRRRRTV